jgi:hypothetical protein
MVVAPHEKQEEAEMEAVVANFKVMRLERLNQPLNRNVR